MRLTKRLKAEMEKSANKEAELKGVKSLLQEAQKENANLKKEVRAHRSEEDDLNVKLHLIRLD